MRGAVCSEDESERSGCGAIPAGEFSDSLLASVRIAFHFTFSVDDLMSWGGLDD